MFYQVNNYKPRLVSYIAHTIHALIDDVCNNITHHVHLRRKNINQALNHYHTQSHPHYRVL